AELELSARRSAAAFDLRELAPLTSTRVDRSDPAFMAVKARLNRLRESAPDIRVIHLFGRDPVSGGIILLAESEPADVDADQRFERGDSQRARLDPETFADVLAGDGTMTRGPVTDDAGTWVSGYARVPGIQAGQPVVLLKIDVKADEWDMTLWGGAIGTAAYVWMFLILPLATLVSTRRQNRQRDTLRNLNEAMEQGQTAVMIVARNQRIQYANAGFCRQLGYAREELIGREWRDFQAFDAPAGLIDELIATVGKGEPWSGEWKMRRKDGGYFPAHGGVTPVKDSSGIIRSFVLVFEDMTEIRQTESMLREAKERAEAGDRAKGQFLATMSHEIRTPLNGIVGFASLLLDTELTPEQQEFVATIRTSSETLIQLTGDILDYARIESGRLKLEPQPCDPRVCVENALDLVASIAAAKKIELLHWVDDSVPSAILVDVGRLRQVLVNLLNNAVKFTPSGEVEVRVRALADRPVTEGGANPAVLEFSIRDTGIGIDPEHHARIFRPFSQVDESTTRRFGGTGLGLAICKNIVELMDGSISFVSAPGVGSTFTFTIRASLHATDEIPEVVPNLADQRLALVVESAGLREELTRLGRRLKAEVIPVDFHQLTSTSNWDIAVVDVSDAIAVELASRITPHEGLAPEKIVGLVSIALPAEVRSLLRTHFRVLLNKPPHHDTLCSLLGTRASASPFQSPAPAPRADRFDLSVLIAEDNIVNQQLIQRVITNLGCRWSAVENGRAALESLTKHTPDVVLMDLHMPEMDGLSATKKIRAGASGEAARNVWIIALTADARAEQRQRTLAAGANDYLTKPVRLPELTQALRRFMKSREPQV
ncbi:MAG TPA: ATP-binding protein, partial [Opitutus sp.]|nr:ATP-binding protein [Opitutus sp.]